MLRLLAWLITGFWPSRASLHALRKDVDELSRRLVTLTKRHNTLAGSYYSEFEEELPRHDAPGRTNAGVYVTTPGLAPARTDITPADDFPDDEFNELVNQKRVQRMNGGSDA